MTVSHAAKSMAEKELRKAVMEMAKAFGWEAYHQPDSRQMMGDPGFPDLCLMRAGNPPRLVFAELKTMTGRLSAGQVKWLGTLSDLQESETYIWRPTDWFDGTIEEVLR